MFWWTTAPPDRHQLHRPRNWEGRSGFNGADVKIVNGSTANISGNHGGYGIHANNLLL